LLQNKFDQLFNAYFAETLAVNMKLSSIKFHSESEMVTTKERTALQQSVLRNFSITELSGSLKDGVINRLLLRNRKLKDMFKTKTKEIFSLKEYAVMALQRNILYYRKKDLESCLPLVDFRLEPLRVLIEFGFPNTEAERVAVVTAINKHHKIPRKAINIYFHIRKLRAHNTLLQIKEKNELDLTAPSLMLETEVLHHQKPIRYSYGNNIVNHNANRNYYS